MKKINKKESIYKLYAPPEEEIGMEFICTMLMNYERNYKNLKKENDKLTKLLLGKSLGFNDYICKDILRNKIKELEEEQKEYKESQEWEIQDDIQAKIDILNELLKEQI